MKNWVWLVVAGVVIYLLWRSRQKAIPQEAPPTERRGTPWIPRGGVLLTEEQIRKARGQSPESLIERIKKGFKTSERPSGPPEEFLGLGATGTPRRGRPKSEYERMLTHYSRFGTTKVPPRGTGLTR